jgi:hypothetical protein
MYQCIIATRGDILIKVRLINKIYQCIIKCIIATRGDLALSIAAEPTTSTFIQPSYIFGKLYYETISQNLSLFLTVSWIVHAYNVTLLLHTRPNRLLTFARSKLPRL